MWVDEAARDIAEGVAEKAVTLTALAQLSDQDRELLTLLAWHDLTAAEAAYDVGDYKIMGRMTMEWWMALSAKDIHVRCTRWLGFQPVTEADRAAWQRAGSPASINADRKQPGRTLTLEPGRRECGSLPKDGDTTFHIADVPYSLEQLRPCPPIPNPALRPPPTGCSPICRVSAMPKRDRHPGPHRERGGAHVPEP